MFKCHICNSTESHIEYVNETFEINDKSYFVEKIPATVCSNCGKEIFSNKVSEAIRSTLNNQSDSSNQEQTEKQYGFGSLKGKIWISDDFDAPLEELAEYM
jgi:YgiT-type zinc finger domain-containing protein